MVLKMGLLRFLWCFFYMFSNENKLKIGFFRVLKLEP